MKVFGSRESANKKLNIIRLKEMYNLFQPLYLYRLIKINTESNHKKDWPYKEITSDTLIVDSNLTFISAQQV